MEGVSCHHCIDDVTDEQKERFAERQKQIELAQARGEGSAEYGLQPIPFVFCRSMEFRTTVLNAWFFY